MAKIQAKTRTRGVPILYFHLPQDIVKEEHIQKGDDYTITYNPETKEITAKRTQE